MLFKKVCQGNEKTKKKQTHRNEGLVWSPHLGSGPGSSRWTERGAVSAQPSEPQTRKWVRTKPGSGAKDRSRMCLASTRHSLHQDRNHLEAEKQWVISCFLPTGAKCLETLLLILKIGSTWAVTLDGFYPNVRPCFL